MLNNLYHSKLLHQKSTRLTVFFLFGLITGVVLVLVWKSVTYRFEAPGASISVAVDSWKKELYLLDANKLSVVNVRTSAVVRQKFVSPGTVSATLNLNTGDLWFYNVSGRGTLVVIEGDSLEEVQRISFADKIVEFVLDQHSNNAYVLLEGGELHKVDTVTFEDQLLTTELPPDVGNTKLLRSVGPTVYLLSRDQNTMYVYNETEQTLRSQSLEGVADFYFPSYSGSGIMAADQLQKTISIYDPIDGTKTRELPLLGAPQFILYSITEDWLYALNTEDSSVVEIIEMSTGIATTVVTDYGIEKLVELSPKGEDGRLLLLSNAGFAQLLNTESNEIIATQKISNVSCCILPIAKRQYLVLAADGRSYTMLIVKDDGFIIENNTISL